MQFVGGVIVNLHVNSGQTVMPNRCSKSHYQVMNVGEDVGTGEPAFLRGLLSLAEAGVFLPPHRPIPR